MVRAVPAALATVAAVTAAGGAVLGTSGVRDHTEATTREDAAREQYRVRRKRSDALHEAVERNLAAFTRLQRESHTAVVVRTAEILREHGRNDDSGRLLADGLPRPVTVAANHTADEPDTGSRGSLPVGNFGTLGAEKGAGALFARVADKFGRASTGTRLNALAGVARERATDAWSGGGSLESGGGGIAFGLKLRSAAVTGPAVLAVGFTVKAAGMVALFNAERIEDATAAACADLDEADAGRRVVDHRVANVSMLLKQLTTQAVPVLDGLDHPMGDHELDDALARALMLADAVQHILATPLKSLDAPLTLESEKQVDI